jgi:hypothetical protein
LANDRRRDTTERASSAAYISFTLREAGHEIATED